MIDTSNISVIQIGTVQAALGVAVVLIGMGVAWGTLKTLVSSIKKTLDEEIKPDLKNVRERFMIVEDRVETIWQERVLIAHSPRKLTTRGNQILNESGIKEIIDSNKAKLFEVVKERRVTNAYDAEQTILEVVRELPQHVEIGGLKDNAFKVGTDIDTILLVGGIYLRDLIFPDLGFSLDDIDKTKTA